MNGNSVSPGFTGANFAEAGLIILLGGIGGLLSWIYAMLVGPPPKLSPWAAIPSSIALGMGAAFIGVYVIANSDTRAFMRCLGFALLCGFTWKPIYDAGSALIDKHAQERQQKTTLNLLGDATRLAKGLAAATPTELPDRLTQTIKTTSEAVVAAQKVDSRTVQQEVSAKTIEILKEITAVKKTHPEVAEKALKPFGREMRTLAIIDPNL